MKNQESNEPERQRNVRKFNSNYQGHGYIEVQLKISDSICRIDSRTGKSNRFLLIERNLTHSSFQSDFYFSLPDGAENFLTDTCKYSSEVCLFVRGKLIRFSMLPAVFLNLHRNS